VSTVVSFLGTDDTDFVVGDADTSKLREFFKFGISKWIEVKIVSSKTLTTIERGALGIDFPQTLALTWKVPGYVGVKEAIHSLKPSPTGETVVATHVNLSFRKRVSNFLLFKLQTHRYFFCAHHQSLEQQSRELTDLLFQR